MDLSQEQEISHITTKSFLLNSVSLLTQRPKFLEEYDRLRSRDAAKYSYQIEGFAEEFVEVKEGMVEVLPGCPSEVTDPREVEHFRVCDFHAHSIGELCIEENISIRNTAIDSKRLQRELKAIGAE